MNKFFTSLLMLGAVFTVSAQNFTVSSINGQVANGSTIKVGYTADYDEEIQFTFFNWDPELVLTAQKAGNYTVTATASEGQIVQFCGIDGQCKILNPTVSKSAHLAAQQSIDLQLDIKDGYEKLANEVSMDVTITDGSETLKFTVIFTNDELQGGINSVEANSGAFRFSGRTLNFSLDNPANFTLYNISGRQMMSRALSGTGSVSLSAIPAGVYVYRCGTTTGKVIIK